MRRGEVAQTMYTHVSECKNDKIKERRKEKSSMALVWASLFEDDPKSAGNNSENGQVLSYPT
jgi:hypothetical protein